MIPRIALLFSSAVAFACALPAQLLTLRATSSQGSAGRYCDPIDCTPDPLPAASNDTIQLTVGGTWQPVLLLVSPPPARCKPLPGIPGIGNFLITQSEPLVLLPFDPKGFGRLYISWGPGPHPTCVSTFSGGEVLLPDLPVGAQFLVQAYADWGGPVLSNALLITIQ